jgi:hypothetical protein
VKTRDHKKEYARQKELHGAELVTQWRRLKRQQYERLYGKEYTPKRVVLPAASPTEQTIREANFAYSGPVTIHQFVMGDPPRGRSALERRA